MNPATAIALVLSMLRACAPSSDGDDVRGTSDLGVRLDGGVVFEADGSVADAGPEGVDDSLYADPSRRAGNGEVLSPGTDGSSDSIAGCFDGLDSDDDALVDCDDPDCFSNVHSCCAGRGDCCATPTTEVLFADPSALGGCAADPSGCLPATGFGAPTAYVSDGLSGGGDGSYDSGLLFDAELDPSAERIALRAELALPADCAAGCMESVAFGLTRQSDLDAQSHVEPLLALLLSPSRGEVSLLAGDRTLGRWPASAGVWSLVAAPDGVLGVESPAGSWPISERYAPVSAARMVVWGHNANPSASADAGARLRSLALERGLCDMPRAWGPAEPLTTAGETLPASGRPSVALWEDALVLAQAVDGAIQLWVRPQAGGTWDAATALESSTELSGELSDPELVAYDGQLHIFAVHRIGDGPSRLVRSTGTPTEGFTAPSVVFDPADYGVQAIRRPTIAERAGVPALVMVAEVEPAGGERSRQGLTSSDGGASWQLREPIELPVIDDAEELGAASLVVRDGAYVLYTAVRRGTRWRLAHLASDDFRHWRVVDSAAFDGASAEHAPLGARAADALTTTDRVDLVFLGLDGVEPTLLGSWRPAADLAILPAP